MSSGAGPEPLPQEDGLGGVGGLTEGLGPPLERDHRIELPVERRRVEGLLREAAEIWGADYDGGSGGRLELPIEAGLRTGRLACRTWTEAAASGCHLLVRVEESRYRLRLWAVGLLVAGAAGGISAMLWPLWPPELGTVPALGMLMAVATWLTVVARLKTNGADDFLTLVADLAEEGEEEAEDRAEDEAHAWEVGNSPPR